MKTTSPKGLTSAWGGGAKFIYCFCFQTFQKIWRWNFFCFWFHPYPSLKSEECRQQYFFGVPNNIGMYPFPGIVQKNRNFLKEYWILRNILLPFNRIRIWFLNILLPLKGSRSRVVKILLQQNFNRIFRLATFGWTICSICDIFYGNH